MSTSSLRVLLTGATGFIGSQLLPILLARGHHVSCVVRDAGQLPKSVADSPRLKVIRGDLRSDSTLRKLPCEIDVVLHLAALLGDSGAKEQEIVQSNLDLTEKLLNWFSSSAAQQFIFVSTPGVQGLGHRAASENAPYNPHGIYEQTKMLAEQSLQAAAWRDAQSWTIVRPDFVYGPGDTRRIKLYRKIQKRHWVKVGRGTAVVRPTYVEDVCEALMVCLKNPKAYGQIFNIAGPELVSIDSFISTIARLLGVRLLPLRLPAAIFRLAAAFFETLAGWAGKKPLFTQSQVAFLTKDHGTDISHIAEKLEFCPQVRLEEGMRRTFQWAKEVQLLSER